MTRPKGETFVRCGWFLPLISATHRMFPPVVLITSTLVECPSTVALGWAWPAPAGWGEGAKLIENGMSGEGAEEGGTRVEAGKMYCCRTRLGRSSLTPIAPRGVGRCSIGSPQLISTLEQHHPHFITHHTL